MLPAVIVVALRDGAEGVVQSVAGFASLHVAITLLVALMVRNTPGELGRTAVGQDEGAPEPRAEGLTFAEAVWGCTKEVKVTRAVACATCNATGAAPGSKPETCRTCQGKGQVVHSQGFFMVQTTCPHCRGAGKTRGRRAALEHDDRRNPLDLMRLRRPG